MATTLPSTTLSRVRNEFARTAERWDRTGYRIFYRALMAQAEQFLEAVRGQDIISTAMVDAITEAPMEEAFREFYIKVANQQLDGVRIEQTQKRLLLGIFDIIANYISGFLSFKIAEITRTSRREIIRLVTTQNAADIESLSNALIRQSMLKTRAMMIARTETIASLNLSRLVKAEASRYDKIKFWVDSHDARVRPAQRRTRFNHHARTIPPVPYNEPFIVSGERLMFPGDVSQGASAGNLIRCYLPDTEIEGNIKTAQRSFYSGEVLEIVTVGGKRLSVTPNHGVFTDKGLIPAKSLNVGDNLICDAEKVGWGFRLINNYIKKKMTAADIFRSFSVLFVPKSVMVRALDFDGDGDAMHGKVDIVDAHSKLRDWGISKVFKRIGNFLFKKPHLEGVFLGGFGVLDLRRYWNNSTLGRLMSLLILSFPLCFRHVCPLNFFRLGPSSKLDAMRFKNSVDNLPGEPVFTSELINTNSVEVRLDKVAFIKKRVFSGHVYDFSSVNGANIANGIYTSNCRCTLAFVNVRDRRGNLVEKNRSITNLNDVFGFYSLKT